jgi:hypothetical protein
MATLAYIKNKVGNAIAQAVSDNGKSMAEQITEKACTLLEEKVPIITNNITNEVISKLNEKIDSEAFSKDFVNVLQQKLLMENKTSEPFLSKFSELFDRVIEKAEENKNAELDTSPVNTKETSTPIIAEPTTATPIQEATANTVSTKPEQTGGNKNKTTRRNKRKVKFQTHKRKRRTNKRHNK